MSSPLAAGSAAKSSAPVKVKTAPKAAPAQVAFAARQFSATNGKWTIGGLNKHDAYKLVTSNGM